MNGLKELERLAQGCVLCIMTEAHISSTPWTNGHRPKEIENRWPKGKAKVKGRSSYKQHALKGQKLLAQGIALGINGNQQCAL